MPWSNPERWLSIPIIAAMLGIFWKSVDTKKKALDESLFGYVTKDYCAGRQENMTLRLEKTIQFEIGQLKDETIEHMRAIEAAIRDSGSV